MMVTVMIDSARFSATVRAVNAELARIAALDLRAEVLEHIAARVEGACRSIRTLKLDTARHSFLQALSVTVPDQLIELLAALRAVDGTPSGFVLISALATERPRNTTDEDDCG